METPDWLKRWFGYTRRERSGTLVLAFILLGVVLVKSLRHDAKSPTLSPEIETAGIVSERDTGDAHFTAGVNNSRTIYGETADGNTGGLTGRKTGSINTHPRNVVTVRKEAEPVYLNQADSSMLESLPGIGPVLAKRIVKFRSLLGGFYSYEQLNEVYGLPGEVIELNRNNLIIDSVLISKIGINSATFGELLRHPYIELVQVKEIVNYRKLAGPFTDLGQLERNKIFTPGQLKRVAPYLLIDTIPKSGK